MGGLSRSFRRRAADELEMWTNQPFTTPITLGDIGVINNGRFDTAEATSLQALGIDIGDPLTGQAQKLSWQASDDSSLDFTIKAKGENLPGFTAVAAADAGFLLKFGKKGSYLFETDEAVIQRINETEAFHAALVKARRDRKIRRPDRIVVAVLKAKRVRLYLSETRECEVEAKASANFASVVEAGVQFTTKRSKGSVLELSAIGDGHSVVFMKLIRIRWLGDDIDVVNPRGLLPPGKRLESTADPAGLDFAVVASSPREELRLEDDEG
jgi:hypothetical protein